MRNLNGSQDGNSVDYHTAAVHGARSIDGTQSTGRTLTAKDTTSLLHEGPSGQGTPEGLSIGKSAAKPVEIVTEQPGEEQDGSPNVAMEPTPV